jgi:benzoylformate decarboxylase
MINAETTLMPNKPTPRAPHREAAPTAPNLIHGRNAFLAILRDEGITHLFGNPGTTELPIMHALKDFPDLSFVMAMQESLVVAMADGFSRASGKLVAANVHVAPGLGNALGSLYNAKFTGTPMILTAGQQEQGHGLMEPLLYDPLVPMAAPLVKWAIEVTRLEDLPRILRRAAKVAMSPPTGPVFISLPGDILNAQAGIDLGASSRILSRVRPDDTIIAGLAARLIAAERPVIIVGDEIVKSDALSEAGELAEVLGAPVWQQPTNYGAHFVSAHPAYAGTIPRLQPQAREILQRHDLMIALGADPLQMSIYSEVDPMPPGLATVQIGLVDWNTAKNYAVEQGVHGDVKATLAALVPALKRSGGTALAKKAKARLAELASTNWTAKRAALIPQIEAGRAASPISADWLTLQVARAAEKGAILVNESLTTGRYMTNLFPFKDRFDFHSLASGGIGWSVPAAVGVSLAQPGRPVICFVGDGSAMYSIQALWTAAHQKLPITYVIANNGGYRIIKQRLRSFHQNENYIGMDFVDPPVDFTALARSLGVRAERIADPDAIGPALARGLAGPGPTLLEVMVDGKV